MRVNTHRSGRRSAFAAVLAVLLLAGAPAAAEPVFRAQPTLVLPLNVIMSIVPGPLYPGDPGYFDNPGTNPRFTDASFSTLEWYDPGFTGVHRGRVFMKTKDSAALNALPSPPPNPFTVDVTVTMTNDEGETASGTITFETTYSSTSASTPLPVPPVAETGPHAPPDTQQGGGGPDTN